MFAFFTNRGASRNFSQLLTLFTSAACADLRRSLLHSPLIRTWPATDYYLRTDGGAYERAGERGLASTAQFLARSMRGVRVVCE